MKLRRSFVTVFLIVFSLRAPASLGACETNGSDELHIQIDRLSDIVQKLKPDEEIRNVADFKNPAISASVLSEDEVQQLFKILASIKEIPFKYPEEGCYARALEMSRVMDQLGITSVRAFVAVPHTYKKYPNGTQDFIATGPMFYVKTRNSPKGYVEWNYHTAPVVLVKDHGKLVPTVIDPSIFDSAVPVQTWIATMSAKEKPVVQLTYHNRFDYGAIEETAYDDAKNTDYNAIDVKWMSRDLSKYLHEQKARQPGNIKK